jgi:hypothetical protein
MLQYIRVRQSREKNHPELWYAYLQWDNNWYYPDFTQCSNSPESSLKMLYDIVFQNLDRIGCSKEFIAGLEVKYL